MAEKSKVKPPPKCKAILLCESIWREEGTRKVSLMGLINSQTLASFPGRTKPMRLFLHLVDGIGEYDTSVEFHDLAEDRIIARGKGRPIRFHSRLDPVQEFFVLPPLLIPHAGKYDVVVFANGQEVYQFQLTNPEEEGTTI